MAKKDKLDLIEKDGEGIGSKLLSAFFVLLIILVWLVIIIALIKFDVGGFGNSVLRPILKDVPVVNLILPKPSDEQLAEEVEDMGEETRDGPPFAPL